MTHESEAWNWLLRAVEVSEPFLPALRPYLAQLRSLVAEAPLPASRDLRRRAFRVQRSKRRKNLNGTRQNIKCSRI